MWSSEDRDAAEAVAGLSYCNPFLPERIALEQRVLGSSGQARAPVWTPTAEFVEDPAIASIQRRAEGLLAHARVAVERGAVPTEHEAEVYDGMVLYVLYYRYQQRFIETIVGRGAHEKLGEIYDDFCRDLAHLTGLPGLRSRREDASHLFALLYQIRRAFHFIFRGIFGASMVVARVRATVWQSVFTHDQFRHQRVLYRRMHELTTLITGPSGTGKELVARAIGFSGYIPFDAAQKRFRADYRECFHPLNLSAFSKTLVESELFGHKKGAFTGATGDRDGYLSGKVASDVVFLDEIGELDEEIQVKLLRVLQTRRFQRLGDGRTLEYGGKIIAATNRDLGLEMERGAFRRDFFYRLCSDVIVTPALRDILDDDPAELENLVIVLSQQLLGEADPTLVAEVLDTIENDLGAEYAWPGNIRELEQCVRNVLVRGRYRPAPRSGPGDASVMAQTFSALASVELELEALTRFYCTWAYARAGTFEDAADRLGCDRRTVSKHLDRALLAELKRSAVNAREPTNRPFG